MAAAAAFDAVGSIIVIAMILCPPATARLLTNDIKTQVFLSLILALGATLIGYVAAGYLPLWLGYSNTLCSGDDRNSQRLASCFFCDIRASSKKGDLKGLEYGGSKTRTGDIDADTDMTKTAATRSVIENMVDGLNDHRIRHRGVFCSRLPLIEAGVRHKKRPRAFRKTKNLFRQPFQIRYV